MSLNKYKGFNSLPVTGTKEAISKARKEISLARSGTPVFLKSRLTKVNNALIGGFRFRHIYMFAGASGSGKSYFLNQLRNDFLDPKLNGNFPHPFKILCFNFEMPTEDELVRTVSSKLNMNYADIMSAYTPLDESTFDKVIDELEALDHPDVHFVETSGNRMEVYNTVIDFYQRFPSHKLVVMFDHTLLTEEYDERSEIEMLAKLSKLFVKLKKTEIEPMIIMLSQMNDKIEDPLRVSNHKLHYPTKKDIHGSKQLYWACDDVAVLHRPEMLNISKYGDKGIDTTDLIAYHQIKSRKGIVGMCRLKAEFPRITQF